KQRAGIRLEEGGESPRKRALAASGGTVDRHGLSGRHQDRRAVQDPAILPHHHELPGLERRGHFAATAVTRGVAMVEPYGPRDRAAGRSDGRRHRDDERRSSLSDPESETLDDLAIGPLAP